MSEYKDKWPDNYIPGLYRVEAVGNTFAEGPSGPYLMLNVRVLSQEPSRDGKPTKPQAMGGFRFCPLYFTEGTIKKTQALFDELGFSGDVAVLDASHPNHVDLSGEFLATLENESYNGKLRDKLSPYVRGSVSNKWMDSFKPVAPAKLMMLNALFNANKKGTPAAKHVANAQSAPTGTPEPKFDWARLGVQDSDIPF